MRSACAFLVTLTWMAWLRWLLTGFFSCKVTMLPFLWEDTLRLSDYLIPHQTPPPSCSVHWRFLSESIILSFPSGDFLNSSFLLHLLVDVVLVDCNKSFPFSLFIY